ncbi:hypothetical protein BC629DRAFT_1601629 [Irpex lacteus]|nr:hypothetical protein BC629DRAFT_1601629 [Irpex lacteus]
MPMDVSPSQSQSSSAEVPPRTLKPVPDDKYRVPLDHHKSGGESPHLITCQWMLSGEDATTVSVNGQDVDTDPSMVTVLDIPPPGTGLSAWKVHTKTVGSMLCEGRVAAVLKKVAQERPSYEWGEEALVDVTRRNPNGAVVEWQSARMDESLFYQNKGKLGLYSFLLALLMLTIMDANSTFHYKRVNPELRRSRARP